MRLRALFVIGVLTVAAPSAQQRSIDDFFRTISDDWVRMNPNLAVATRYFSGEEQDRLEQQITSYAEKARADRSRFIKRGLSELAAFDRSRMTDLQRTSADLLRYQLEAYLEWDRYERFEFPLDQGYGANVALVSTLTVTHPMRRPKDAANYVARLGRVGQGMAEAVANAKRLAASDRAEAYAAFLKLHTTTNLKPDEIHEIGVRQVASIEREMDTIFRTIGRTDGSVNARWDQLLKDRAYPQTEDGRKQAMADIDVMIRDAERRSALLFDRRPKSPIIAQPYPRFREANAAPSYLAPPLDGSRPGIFQMTLRPEYMSKPRLRTLVYHETVPGHHFQIALAVENTALPKFRQVRLFGGAGATTEGWGLYAERLAAESGWYEGDPEGLLGHLYAQLFRARRLVVDTGIHAKRWTRQQAIAYGISPSEVERYVVNPGQACSYMIGQLKILELRDRAKAALKDRYSDRAFHNAVLEPGIVPLELLESETNRYIRGARN